MQILFVENHTRFAEVTVARFLAGHGVTVVPSVADARRVLAGKTFGVVLVDYDLDDGKGDELVPELRAQVPRPVIVAVSSHDAGNAALMAAGADAVCGKLQFSTIETVLARLFAVP